MKRISFAWTLKALLAGRKTVTRRDWKDRYAKTFHEGELVEAWDKQPRAGGHCVATIRLTAAPSKESTAALLYPADWEEEGFAYMQEEGLKVNGQHPAIFWRGWIVEPRPLWAVRFKLVGLGRITEAAA